MLEPGLLLLSPHSRTPISKQCLARPSAGQGLLNPHGELHTVVTAAAGTTNTPSASEAFALLYENLVRVQGRLPGGGWDEEAAGGGELVACLCGKKIGGIGRVLVYLGEMGSTLVDKCLSYSLQLVCNGGVLKLVTTSSPFHIR